MNTMMNLNFNDTIELVKIENFANECLGNCDCECSGPDCINDCDCSDCDDDN